jgi:hypothetical protein
MSIPHFFQNVAGWFDFDDIYSEQVARAKDGAQFLELGVCMGKSASFMCVEIANSGKKIDFWGVDKFDWPVGVYTKCYAALKDGKVRDKIRLIQETSQTAHCRFDDGFFDFIFIDANHEYVSVALDLRIWFPKLKTGGVIGGHDYAPNQWGEFPGVKKAVDEFFGPRKLRVALSRSSWIVRT